MKKAAAVLAGVALTLAPLGGAAVAEGQSPVRHVQEGSAHTHHVHTGSGDCVDIASVFFIAADHGLHQGANSSSFGNVNDPDTARGPFHGTCSGLRYPGGPVAPSHH